MPRDKLILGIAALAIWILLFAAGLLIETVEYRLVLAPRSVGKQLGPEEMKSLPQQVSAGGNAPATVASTSTTGPVQYSAFYAFLASVVCFTPINLAILTLTAGLLGGCASNITIETMPESERAKIMSKHPRRHLYLQEPPVSAAIRGFIVFLCVIAGLYVAMDDPFKDPTPGQYIRLAGTLSILALMVGYDSSRLEDWLRIIPGPGNAAARGSNGQQSPPAADGASAMVVQEHLKITTEREFASAGVQKRGNGDLKAAAAETSIPGTEKEAADKVASAEKSLDSGGA